MENEIKDLIIIGSGPAGLSAAVYGKRATLDELLIEKDIYGGGQIAVTEQVDNYLGLYGLSGYELAMKFKEHAEVLEVPVLDAEVTAIKNGEVKEVVLANGEILYTKAIFLSTGANPRKLGCKGENEFVGMGVSYCATCDGAFFRNKTVVVVGGGDVALQDALFLANICKKVYLIHRRDSFRAAKYLQDKIFAKDNIEFIPFHVVEEIQGEGRVQAVVLKDVISENVESLAADGVFIAVGMKPNSELVKDIVELDSVGYVVADESCRTSEKGIYAIGDIRTKQLRQLVTAVSDGANAITSLEEDLLEEKILK